MQTLKLIICLAIIGLIPVIVDPTLHNAFVMPKFVVLLVGVTILICLELWEGKP